MDPGVINLEVCYLWPPKGEASRVLSRRRTAGECRRASTTTSGFGKTENSDATMLATVKGVREPWAAITDESPSLQTLWQYVLCFRIEELFLDSKSGAFELDHFCIRSAASLERLYLVAAVALLYGTTQGLAVGFKGGRRQVDCRPSLNAFKRSSGSAFRTPIGDANLAP